MDKRKTSLEVAVTLFIISYFFWDTYWVLPVKYLTVFFHELSHGLMALVTGGKIIKISLDWMEGGYCLSNGGNFLLIASAGYIGSLLWGCLFLIVSNKFGKGKILLQSIVTIFAISVLLYIRNAEGLAICFGLILLIKLVLKYIKNETAINAIASYIGLSSCFYAILDIKDDLIDRANQGFPSDASQIAKIISVSPIVIGVVWFIIALFVTYKALMYIQKK